MVYATHLWICMVKLGMVYHSHLFTLPFPRISQSGSWHDCGAFASWHYDVSVFVEGSIVGSWWFASKPHICCQRKFNNRHGRMWYIYIIIYIYIYTYIIVHTHLLTCCMFIYNWTLYNIYIYSPIFIYFTNAQTK